MSKRLVAVALFLVVLSASPLLAAPSHNDGDQPSRSVISRIIHRVIHALDDWSWPKP
jgi:hypothetical protein